MRRSQAHALRQILQAAIGYIDLGIVALDDSLLNSADKLSKAKSCIHDADRVISREVPPMVKPMNSWTLGDGAYINVDVVTSDLVQLQITARGHVTVEIILNAYVAHQIGDVLIGAADYAGLPARKRTPLDVPRV
jgi:hypothetical protein